MEFDPQMEQERLDELAKEYLVGNTESAKFVFFSAPDGDYVGHGRWSIDQDLQTKNRESGFSQTLMEQLHMLLKQRVLHNKPNARQGVVHIDGDRLSVEWLPEYLATEYYEEFGR